MVNLYSFSYRSQFWAAKIEYYFIHGSYIFSVFLLLALLFLVYNDFYRIEYFAKLKWLTEIMHVP